MNQNNNPNFKPTIITAVIMGLVFGFYTDFGEKYGSRISSREQDEITVIVLSFLAVVVVVFLLTKNNNFGKIAHAPIKKTIDNRMKKEISEYIQIIEGLSDEELGMAVLSALTLRKKILDKTELDLMDPLDVLNNSPDIIITLSKSHEEHTANNKPYLTVPITIWVHTLRSISNPMIRSLGRKMWKELSRGFKHIEEKKDSYEMIYGEEAVSDMAGAFPIGLNPSEIEFKTETNKKEIQSEDKEAQLKELNELFKKGLITKEALTNLQTELLLGKKIKKD